MAQNTRFDLSRGRRVVAALDIGTSKVCCAIAGIDGSGGMRLLGFGHQRSRGIKAGMMIDAGTAELAIRAAVGQAERMAGLTVETVHLSINCGRLRSQRFRARGATDAGIVTSADMKRVIGGGEAFAERDDRVLVQLETAGWQLDAAAGIPDPIGLAGRELAADLIAVTIDEAPLRNILTVLEHCYLSVRQLVPAPYASALAVTTEDERRVGVLVVDLGAGTTSMAGFVDGGLCLIDSIPVGASHITHDIGRALSVAPNEAERIKSLYGTLVSATSNDFEHVAYARVGAEAGPDMEPHHVSRAALRSIIAQRVDAALALAKDRLDAAGAGHMLAERVVLTGGGGQLAGLDTFWASQLGGSVRFGVPLPLTGMSTNLASPAFACVLGLLKDAAMPQLTPKGGARGLQSGRYLGWVRTLLKGQV